MSKGNFVNDYLDRWMCDGCTNLDKDTLHRCRANPDSCVEGAKCPDYIGEGNCGCIECGDS